MTITKETIVKKISEDNQWSRSASKCALEKLIDIIFRTLGRGEDILITGFGKFKVHDKRARMVLNPQTFKEIEIEARRVVTFRASGRLKQQTNKKAQKK
jgi:integration host factor subunit alpha